MNIIYIHRTSACIRGGSREGVQRVRNPSSGDFVPPFCAPLCGVHPLSRLGAPKRPIIRQWFQVEVGMEKILLLNI